ncbi:Hemicentin-2 [Myotis davidii]|uniref:Hemicentin-2 n=1 Tax=Myotis davidii TaxID=225400 RepID=L5MG72_MYODS|nr:Hemicentin-2 [Myotis davidii]
MGDSGRYQCLAENEMGAVEKVVVLLLQREPRGGRGSMIGVINGQELGVATLNASVQQEARSGVTTFRSSIGHLPASVGPLMRVLLVTIAPIYWALAGEHGDAMNGHSLTGGSFRQESHMEFSTGELLTMTQVARGLDPDGLLLLDVVVHGVIPESLADADLRAQDFQEDYVQTGPGQLFVGSTQRFLQDSRPVSLRCNHSIQYEAARGPQPQLVQHLQASAISAAYDPAAEALRFQLTTALQADVDECAWPTDLCPEGQRCVNLLGSYRCLPDCRPGFRVAADGADCEDVDECLEQSDECHYNQICENTPGGHRCSCPRGYRTQGPGLPCLACISASTTTTTTTTARPDLDECRVRSLCQHACRNTEGSYQCLCPSGYRLLPSGKNCQDINECEEDGIECGPGQMCFNTRGSYQCVDTPCPATYRQGSSPG